MSNQGLDKYSGDQTLVPGYMRAFRSWRTLEVESKVYQQWSPGTLTAVSFAATWELGVNSAKCFMGAPIVAGQWYLGPFHGKGCSCGFYGLHEPNWDETYYTQNYPKGILSVRGVFKATGSVVIGYQGIRAEKAEIEALLLGAEVPEGFEDLLESKYRVPVYRSEKQFLMDYPPIPSDLIPKKPAPSTNMCPCGCGMLIEDILRGTTATAWSSRGYITNPNPNDYPDPTRAVTWKWPWSRG